MSTITATSLKSVLLWTLIAALAIGTAGWFAVSCGSDRADAERPVTEEEARALAELRHRNFDSEPVAVRLTYPVEGEQVVVDGYLDWRTPLLYVRAPGADGEDRLVQAVPGLVAHRADHETFDDVRVPGQGWSTRQMLAGGAAPDQMMFDILASSLFTLSAEQDADPAYVAERATWQEEGLVDGENVDTYRAPIMVDAGQATASNPEALYSLDEEGSIRRFQVNTGGADLASVEFLREVEFDAAGLERIDLLGGPRIEPSTVDTDLAETLAHLRHENWSSSATVEMTVPVGHGRVASGHGHIDWRTMTAYLNITEDGEHRLVLARPGGLAELPVDTDELPEPLPVEGWETHALGDEDIKEHFGQLETLTYRLLEMAAEDPEDPSTMAEEASLLRVDEIDGEPTHVVEFPVVGDARAEAGQSAFRYHLSGERLRKVELMTPFGVAGAELSYEDYPIAAIPWSVSERIG
ncbi:hypothetical protein GCM10027447_22800 [Glycomyces halotolerans]